MKLIPSDPDVQTLVGRIQRGELDLQPDFQRGEVWSETKKRRLIDTILRDWHIPPIHVIEHADSHKQEVLDGQQRLVAIRDFVEGLIRVDGTIEPYEPDIAAAHNCTYQTLPPNLRRRFDRFPIRVFSLMNFSPDEPGELFFRLNQPVSLTAAEQRNAFFGPVREQVRDLCEQFPNFGLTEEFLGFSNSRMAYDDTVAKLCLSLERRTLREKITASTITERYRRPEPFEHALVERAEHTLRLFGTCNIYDRRPFKFNKATVYSWLCFTTRLLAIAKTPDLSEILSEFVWSFESARAQTFGRADGGFDMLERVGDYPHVLLHVFTDRASLRVADVSSVLLRDVVLWHSFFVFLTDSNRRRPVDPSEMAPVLREWDEILARRGRTEEAQLLSAIETRRWGALP